MGFRKQSIECQLYFWILKSYQHGTRIGGERDSRAKHITAWTKNAAEKFCKRLHLSACVRLRLCGSACVSAHRKLNARTRLDAKKSLHPEESFVQGLSRCTIHVHLHKEVIGQPKVLAESSNRHLSHFLKSVIDLLTEAVHVRSEGEECVWVVNHCRYS